MNGSPSGRDAGRKGRGGAGRQGGGDGGVSEGADLVARDGFVFEEGGAELGERFAVAGEQIAGAGFGFGQEGGDFLVDQPLGALGVAAWRGHGVTGGWLAVA